VVDAKPLFLVDNEQAKVFEMDILRQQAMGADNDVDFAGRCARDGLLLQRVAGKPAEKSYRHGEASHASLEVFVMLLSQNGGRR